MKQQSIPMVLGLVLCLVGEAFRKASMFTAGASFTHLIAYQKRDRHRLVTHGVFGVCRHPAYAGWFWWSIGTQVLLANPICIIGYAAAAWYFFHDRIYDEEITLLNFYGERYVRYQQRVPTGLPFIRGFTPS